MDVNMLEKISDWGGEHRRLGAFGKDQRRVSADFACAVLFNKICFG
jgi:hypothetical protein